MGVQIIKAKLIKGPRDGMEIEVASFPRLVSVASNGDAEAITLDEAADAIAVGHELYRWQGSMYDGIYEHVTLHALMTT